MTRAEKKIAEYFLRSDPDIQTLTISEVAELCGVSTATVTRFTHDIGFKNYMDLRVQMSISKSRLASCGAGDEEQDGSPSGCDIDQKCKKLCDVCADALQQTRLQVDPRAVRRAVDALWDAKTVYCFGQGNSTVIAMDAWSRFVPITTKFHWVSDAHQQSYTSALLARDEVVLYYSFSGSTRELIENAKLIRQAGGKLILVTHFPNAEGAKLADIVLICGANESPKNQGSIAARVAQILITELLYNAYCERNMKLASSNRTRSLDAVRSNHEA